METENRTNVESIIGAGDGTDRADEQAPSTDTLTVSDPDRRKSRRNRREYIPIRGPLWKGEPATEKTEGTSKTVGRKKKRLTKHDKAEQFAIGLLSKIEKSLTNMLDDDCSMDDFERMLVEDPLISLFESADTEMLDRFNAVLAPGALILGFGWYAVRIYRREMKKSPPQPQHAVVKTPVKGGPPKMEVVKKVPSETPPVTENGAQNPDVFDQWANTLGLGE